MLVYSENQVTVSQHASDNSHPTGSPMLVSLHASDSLHANISPKFKISILANF